MDLFNTILEDFFILEDIDKDNNIGKEENNNIGSSSCKFNCSNNVSFEFIKTKIRPIIDKLYSNKTLTSRIIIHEQSDLNFGYDIFGGVFTLCTKDILMIDFDNKDGFTKEKAIDYIKTYTECMKRDHNYDMLFQMYETDRGIHAFLVNRQINFILENALQIMIDLCSDPMYIGYSEVRGFCIRLSPKIKYVTDVQGHVNKEFIAKEIEDNFLIGHGEPLEYSQKILDFHMNMINFLGNLYRNNLREFTEKRYIPESDTFDIFPSESMFHLIAKQINNELKSFNLFKKGSLFPNNIRRKINDIIQIYKSKNTSLIYNIIKEKFILCFYDIAKIKIILTDNSQKMQILDILKGYQELSFWIYDNENELIIYILNEYDNEFNKEEFNNKLKFINDINITFSNYCENLDKENIIYKKLNGNIIKLGSDKILDSIKSILLLQMDIMDYVNNLYIPMEKRYVNQIYKDTLLPSAEIFDSIRDKFLKLLDKHKLNGRELTYKSTFSEKTLVNAYRYADLFDNTYINKHNITAMDSCSRQSIIQLEKNDKYKDKRFTDEHPFIGINYWIKNILGPFLIRNSVNQVTLLNGPLYPFILGFDLNRKMVYIRFYNLLMLDWDTHDGIPKTSPVMMIDRFLSWQENLAENDRVSKADLCFKFYETDNGIHAYIVSHKMPYYLDNSSICMVHTCSDFNYVTMSRFYGYSIRLSPKIYNEDFSLKSDEIINSQFIQRFGVPCNYFDSLKHKYIKKDNRILYLGNLDMIDPELDKLTNFIEDIQSFIVRDENIKINLSKANPFFLENVRNFASNYYNENLRSIFKEIPEDQSEWAIGSNTYQYKRTDLF